MSEKNIDAELKSMRKYRRAGLHYPTHRTRRIIKAQLPQRKCERNVEVFLTAVAEFYLEQLLTDASDHVSEGNYINANHIHKVLGEGNYGNLFPRKVAGLF